MSTLDKKIHHGGFFNFNRKNLLKEKWPEYYYLMNHTIKSEEKLVKALKKYNSITHEYYTKYYEHIDNLIRLDQMFDNFDSFRKSFEIVFGEFKDKNKLSEQSLLLSNYNKSEPFSSPEEIIKHHLIQQIIYLLANIYNSNERLLIKQVIIQDILTKPTISIVTSDGKTTNPIVLPQNKYHLDYVRVKQIIDQAIRHMKDKLNTTSVHSAIEKNPIEEINIALKTMPLIKFNEPLPNKLIPHNFGVNKYTMKNIKPHTISSKKNKPSLAKKQKEKQPQQPQQPQQEAKQQQPQQPQQPQQQPQQEAKQQQDQPKKQSKKQHQKPQAKEQKKINEISIPVEQKMLPALKVEIPLKK
jgi:hypothetical protein